MSSQDDGPTNFIRERIEAEAKEQPSRTVRTRFPPEPNGYLHIGHAKAISLNFTLAKEFGGLCNLRLDDTNPAKEETEFVDAIQKDIRWLGYDWEDRLFYASDYFEKLYQIAEEFVTQGLAYVDSQSVEDIRKNRGNFHNPGIDSPFRSRPSDENLDLLRRMRTGEFAEGAHVLRAKIDMQHKNLNMRDPLMYRILKQPHHRVGKKWNIYPMYDFAHPVSDALENVTHSICTLEFTDHRILYDWFVEHANVSGTPRQIEFAKLHFSYTVVSKRRLQKLVEEGHVDGWDDPRMPTLSGLRRRGVPPAAIREVCEKVGVSRRDGVVDIALLEHAIREELNRTTPRMMAVIDPLKVVIENYPEDEEEFFEARFHPEEDSYGTRPVPFSRELYIEREDFMEEAPKKWFRLAPGREVRLRYACLLTCKEAVKDASGNIIELRCTWDPASRGGSSPDGRKVKGTIHWVSAKHALPGKARLYDRLFSKENPLDVEDGETFLSHLNKDAMQHRPNCQLEPAFAKIEPGTTVQFERLGYFCCDRDSSAGRPVFNRTIALRDSWAKIAKKLGKQT